MHERGPIAPMERPSIIWWVLPAFLAIDAALLIPFKSIQWGYLEDLPLLFVSIGVLGAQFAVLSVWAAMAEVRWWTCLSCFAFVLVGVYGASLVIDELGLPVFLSTACVAFAGALALRWCGWRFQRFSRSEHDQAVRLSWQFSFGELTVFTLGAGVLLGLFRWGGARWLPLDGALVKWLIIGTFSMGVFTSVAVGLTSQRVWRAIGMALVGVPLGVFAILMFVHQNANVMVFVNLIAGACLVPLILLLRYLEIRLVYVPKTMTDDVETNGR
jgi:hypothetical protein